MDGRGHHSPEISARDGKGHLCAKALQADRVVGLPLILRSLPPLCLNLGAGQEREGSRISEQGEGGSGEKKRRKERRRGKRRGCRGPAPRTEDRRTEGRRKQASKELGQWFLHPGTAGSKSPM